MSFEFTRAVAPLLQPIGFLWFLFVLGTIWFLVKRKLLAALGCASLAIVISVIGSTNVPFRLLASLEKPYAGVKLDQLAPADAVVMLGGTLIPSSNDVFGFQLADTADRALTAVELMRLKKAGTLILGGGGFQEKKPNEAQLLERWFLAWNLVPLPITTLQPAKSTYDEAVQVQKIFKQKAWKKVIVVTSASHMKRAVAIFQTAGVAVEPAGCDFSGLSRLETPGKLKAVPDLEGFFALQTYLHEILGWYYYRWHGWIKPAAQP